MTRVHFSEIVILSFAINIIQMTIYTKIPGLSCSCKSVQQDKTLLGRCFPVAVKTQSLQRFVCLCHSATTHADTAGVTAVHDFELLLLLSYTDVSINRALMP